METAETVPLVPRYSWVGIIECPASEETRTRVSLVGNLLTAMMLISLGGVSFFAGVASPSANDKVHSAKRATGR